MFHNNQIYFTPITKPFLGGLTREERRWFFEEPTKSRTSPSILEYAKINSGMLRGVQVSGFEMGEHTSWLRDVGESPSLS